jgi:tetratricopeptide (TPR) repeat protein
MKRISKIAAGLVIALGALLSANVATAQNGGQWVLIDAEGTSLVRMGSDAMYNLRYAEADSIFNILIQRQPDHPVGYFMQALVDWWRIVPNISVNTKVDAVAKSFNARIDKVIEISDARLEKNAVDIVGLFFKGSAVGYRARLEVLKDFDASSILDWVNAANEGKVAYDIILQCQRLAPSNGDILLGSGMYNYLGAYIQERYPTFKALVGFLPPGDKKIGISMLRIAGQRATYANTEARNALLEVYLTWEKNYGEAATLAAELHQQFPGNSVFYRSLARSLYMTQDFEHADSMYVDILRRVERREPGYELTFARQGIYYLGDIRLRRGMYQDAIDYFKEADKLSRRFGEDESAWNVMSNLKMGFAYDRLGKRDDAVRQYKKVLDMDNNADSHDLAEKYLKAAYNGSN